MLYDVPWAKPEFSRGRIDAAGRLLVELAGYSKLNPKQETDYGWALGVINNWRSSHAYPLEVVKMTLRYRAESIDSDFFVAQRLKRFFSIFVKLSTEPRMKLSQMQDIGGCRAVMPTIAGVKSLSKLYDAHMLESRRGRTEVIEKYDYVNQPKPDGYRSIHFVCKYHTSAPRHTAHDGLRVEVQLRTALQHIWATAVETVSTFTGEALRSTVGSKPWRRFFALMGSVIADREGEQGVPHTPTDSSELKRELGSLARRLRVETVLPSYGTAVQQMTAQAGQAGIFLLVLDPEARKVRVEPFLASQLEQATQEYAAIERQLQNQPSGQAVLVWVDSVAALRRAYPNYYLDTTKFLEVVNEALS